MNVLVITSCENMVLLLKETLEEIDDTKNYVFENIESITSVKKKYPIGFPDIIILIFDGCTMFRNQSNGKDVEWLDKICDFLKKRGGKTLVMSEDHCFGCTECSSNLSASIEKHKDTIIPFSKGDSIIEEIASCLVKLTKKKCTG